MGENKDIEKLDAFTKKYIKEVKEESPSLDFTANLMTVLEKETVNIYKATPLISRKGWFFIGVILVASILFVSRGTSLSWMKMPTLQLDFLYHIQMPNLFEGITISNIMLFACFFFTLMIFGQIIMLKNHFTKHL